MAYATQDDVLNYLQGNQNGQQGVDPTSSAQVGGGSSGAGFISGQGGGSPSQSGVGGQKLWTNIQSYLTANQGAADQRADNLKTQVQGTFGQEKDAFNKQATDTKAAADKAAEPVTNVNPDKASQLIAQAGSAQKGSDAYTQAVNPVKQAVTAQYAGPSAFSYGLSAGAQNAGQGVASDEAFKGFLSQFDKNLQGGRDLNTGQRGLQEQLDSQNEKLAQARQDLNSQYGTLTGDIGQGVTDTSKYLQDTADKFKTGQSSLLDYLTGQGTSNRSAIDEAVAQHNQEAVGQQNLYNKYTADNPVTDPNSEIAINWKRLIDPNGDWRNKWAKIADPQDRLNAQVKQFYDWEANTAKIPHADYNEVSQFNPGDYATEENIGGVDQQRNQWNAIMDMLAKTDEIKKAQAEAANAKFTPGFTTKSANMAMTGTGPGRGLQGY